MSRLVIHTDGGSRGNPGPAAAGVVVLFNDEVIKEEGLYLGIKTNNEAEYQAVSLALTVLPGLIKAHQVTEIIWKLDSMLVVQQLSKVWKIKEPRLAKFAQDIWTSLAQLPVKSTFTYVPRAQNAAADAVVNLTLDSQPNA